MRVLPLSETVQLLEQGRPACRAADLECNCEGGTQGSEPDPTGPSRPAIEAANVGTLVLANAGRTPREAPGGV